MFRGGRSAASFPRRPYAIALAAVVLALLPPLWIARTRLVKSATPRLEIFSDMDFQPKYTAQAASAAFRRRPRTCACPCPARSAAADWKPTPMFYRGKAGGEFATTFPMPPTRAMIERGRERFNIYCTTCHGWTGEGGANGGMTDQRAIKRDDKKWVMPTSLQGKEVRKQPVGDFPDHHQRHSQDALLRRPDPAGRPLGHHSLRPRACSGARTPRWTTFPKTNACS